METTKGYLYIDLKTAQDYWEKGGLHKEIALKSGYTEAELNPVRNEWNSKILEKDIDGFYISSLSYVIQFKNNCSKKDSATFKTEKQAKSALAYAQLTQLMALPEYNGDWVPDWNDDKQIKYIIIRFKNKIIKDQSINSYFHIAFKSAAALNKFFENNYGLLKEYFELD